ENEEAPDWLGTKTNLIKHWTGKLVPDSQNLASADLWDTFDVFVPSPYPTATYDAPEVDIGFDDTVRVWAAIISALGPGEAGEAAPQYAIDYKLAAGAYDGFQDWDVGEIELRYLTPRVSVATATGVYYLSSFSHTVDLRERTQKASGIAIAAAGTLITFPISFHTAPFVRVFIDGSSALYATNTNVTTTGFTIHVFNSSGTDVGGVVNWEATGV
ncbi:MAG: H-type lectin domain-containing protein, partial [Rhodospirillaceae bacterium]|nr:H-type lectin domain-containing protein [Rhodospirillaceae bacterium]